MFIQIIIASLTGSVFALVGGILLLTKEQLARKVSLLLVSFAVGSLLGAAFFELLPEALSEIGDKSAFSFVILGLLTLFLFEKFLKWYHCHDRETCDIHTFSEAVLFGDALHNFIDGIIIALSFSLGVPAGIAATIAVFFHEVPQEIGDFGVLLHAGYSKSKILLYNTLTALTTPVGAVVGYIALPLISGVLPQLISFAAGTFIYIAISDLMPELRHKTKGPDFAHLFAILLGLLVLWGIGILFPE
ncbi:MAG: ZIP family metal transporter [Patescibacteria group bacterium]|nr:ZIP family metal transporter [Patescibacteria group bacterium]